jgi:hypothetical protein
MRNRRLPTLAGKSPQAGPESGTRGKNPKNLPSPLDTFCDISKTTPQRLRTSTRDRMGYQTASCSRSLAEGSSQHRTRAASLDFPGTANEGRWGAAQYGVAPWHTQFFAPLEIGLRTRPAWTLCPTGEARSLLIIFFCVAVASRCLRLKRQLLTRFTRP